MAQTKRKRRSKHRGTAAGTIEARGRTGRKPRPEEVKADARARREAKLDRPPTWKGAFAKSGFAALVLFVLVQVNFFSTGSTLLGALGISAMALIFYAPLTYALDRFMWRRRMARKAT